MTLSRQFQRVGLLLAVCISLSAFADKISDIHPVNYVTDLAGVLDADTSGRINALAGEVERKTSAQIAIVTVKSLDGRPVEDYAVDLYKHLGVGHKDDRGVLLLVAPNDRRYRIEVGYGLEPVINDARAGDIGRAMVPYLRANDYSSAIAFAANRLASEIAQASHVTLSTSPAPVRSKGSESGTEFPWWLVLAVGAIAFPFIRAIARGSGGRRRRRGPGSWWYGGPGLGGWGGGGWSSGGGGWGGGGSFGGGSFGGFGGGSSGGGGASGSW